jgi:diacylglycerol kinase
VGLCCLLLKKTWFDIALLSSLVILVMGVEV